MAAFREWRRRARVRHDLAYVDDRTLRELGTTRAQVEFDLQSRWRRRLDRFVL